MEWVISALSVALTAAVAYLTYTVQSNRQKTDARSELFDDALLLKDNYKSAYDQMLERFDILSCEVQELREEIHELKFWKGVAREAVVDYKNTHDTVPKWWPPTESVPEVT